MSRKSVLFVLVVIAISNISALGFYIHPAKGIVWIEGHITSNTTWSPIDVYRVINDTYIDHGVTLTIQPEVQIQFADGFSLIVQGSLNATGEESEPIVFSSSRVAPSPGVWNTIRFEGTLITMKYCTVSYSTNGITILGDGTAVVQRCEFTNSYEDGLVIRNAGNVVIRENTIQENGLGGIMVTGSSNITLVDNFVANNSWRENYTTWGGIHLTAAMASVTNVLIDNNTLCSHQGYPYCSGISTHVGLVSNVTISNNRIFGNENGILIYQDTRNLQIFRNIIYQNTHGIYAKSYEVVESINVFDNSICYNTYGVLIEKSGIEPHFNDVYSNTYGMNITSVANVNATYNYWGSPAGPYHTSLNPEGKGNPVNGNGVNLDFIPFLTSPTGIINERPVAVLRVSKPNPMLNETVTFDAADSTDDGRIDYYFFDFGDGTNSSWTTLPVVTHKYAEEGTYNATLIVMDDFGVTSLNGNLVYVEITVVPEFQSMLILPLLMIATLLAIVIHRKNILSNARVSSIPKTSSVYKTLSPLMCVCASVIPLVIVGSLLSFTEFISRTERRGTIS